jgi:hypothetical protein
MHGMPSLLRDEFQSYADRLNQGDPWKRRLHAEDRARQSRQSHSGADDKGLAFMSLMDRQRDGIDEAMGQLDDNEVQVEDGVGGVRMPLDSPDKGLDTNGDNPS